MFPVTENPAKAGAGGEKNPRKLSSSGTELFLNNCYLLGVGESETDGDIDRYLLQFLISSYILLKI